MMTTQLTATTSITTPEYDIPPVIYSFGDYKYITYENNILTDELLYEGIEYLSRFGVKFPKIIEKISIVLSHFQSGYTVPEPTEPWMNNVADLRKEIRQTTLSIQKQIHTINKKIRDHENNKDVYVNITDNYYDNLDMYEIIGDEFYEEQNEYLRLNLEAGICTGFVDDIVDHVCMCDAVKQTLLEKTKLSETNIIYDIIQFL